MIASWRYDLATANVLWRRDLMRFLKQPSRIIGAMGQPLIFWFVVGAGLSPNFEIANLEMDYQAYFYPGVVLMVLLFAAIFSSMSVIEDRRIGFLQCVMAGPGSRMSLVLGKCLGSSSVAIIQALLFVALAPVAGFSFLDTDWLLLAVTMVLASLGLTSFGFLMAWILNNVQAYHAIQMVLLVPLWMISGAMFPPQPDSPVFNAMMTYNPIAHAVSTVRHAMYSGAAPEATVVSSPTVGVAVLAVFALVSLMGASKVCSARR